MLRVFLVCVVFLCITGVSKAQSSIGLELRLIITAELDSTVTENGEAEVNVKLYHPFADENALRSEYYVFQQPKQKAVLKEEDVYIVPFL